MTALGTYYALTPTAGAVTPIVVTTIAALKGVAVQTTSPMMAEGYYAVGDGGGGLFYGVTGAAAGTYVDNGGTIILPTGGDGSAAWLRFSDGTYNVKTFGAKGDGVADDTTAIQNTFNYIVATGKPAKAYIPQGTYKITATGTSALTLDSSFVCLEAEALLDASGLTTGKTALTIIASTNNEVTNYGTDSSFGRQSLIYGNLRLKGPGWTDSTIIGVFFNMAAGTYPTPSVAAVVENMVISSFGIGMLLGNHAWGMKFESCRFFSSGRNIHTPGPGAIIDAGERLVFNNCLIANGFITNVSCNSDNTDMYFTNCSLDYPGQAVGTGYSSGTTLTMTSISSTGLFAKNFAINDPISAIGGTFSAGTILTAVAGGGATPGTYAISPGQTVGSSGSPVTIYGPSGTQVQVTTGRVFLTDCHMEADHSNQALFQVGTYNGASLIISGGELLMRASSAQTVSPISFSQAGTNVNSLLIRNVFMAGMATSNAVTIPYLVSTSVAAPIYATVSVESSFSYGIYTNATLASAINNLLTDGSFALASPVILPDAFVVEATGTITRLGSAGINITLSRNTAITASGCLEAAKAGAATTSAAFAIVGKLNNAGKSVLGFRWQDRSSISTVQYVITPAFATVLPFNAAGAAVPTVENLTTIGGGTTYTPLTAGFTTRIGPGAGWKSPSWATHFVLYFNMLNSPAGSLYIDNVEITEM